MMTGNAPKNPERDPNTTKRQIVVDDFEDTVIGTGKARYSGDDFILDDFDDTENELGGARLVAFCGLSLIGLAAALTAVCVIKIFG